MKNVILYGELAKVAGNSTFKLNVKSIKQAMSLLCANIPQLRKAIIGNEFHVVRGDQNTGWYMGDDDLDFEIGNADVHVMPAAVGSGGGGGGGTVKVVIGVALIGIAIIASGGTLAAPLAAMGTTAFSVGGAAVTFGNLAMLGVAVALAGVSQMLSPTPNVGDYGERESPNDRQSFLFNGQNNTLEQGGPVPLTYGYFRIGSVVISSDITVEQI